MDILAARTPHLRLDRSEPATGEVRLAVIGEVDMSTGDGFRRAVRSTVHEPGLRALSLDVAELGFIDSNGVAVLIGALHDADALGVVFRLTNVGARTRCVLDLMGVYDLLTAGRP